MIRDTYIDGVKRESWNDNTQTYTTYNAQGAQTSQRSYTPQEIAALAADEAARMATLNRATIEQQAATAIDTNIAFLAIASPTNAQVLAQTKALTRQNNGIIRLILNRLEATS